MLAGWWRGRKVGGCGVGGVGDGGGTGQGLSSLNSDHFDQTHRRLDEDAYDDVDIRRTAETARFKDMMTLTQCQDHILYMVCMV